MKNGWSVEKMDLPPGRCWRSLVGAWIMLCFVCGTLACKRRPGSNGAPPASSASAVPSEAAVVQDTSARVGDLVDLPLDTVLAATPAGVASTRSSGSPALVLSVSPSGDRRLLAADGSFGWTSTTLRKLAGTHVVAARALEANRFPVEDPRSRDDQADPWLTFAPGSVAYIVGASREPGAESDEALRLEQAPFLEQPLLLLKTEAAAGFVHGLSFDLEWDPAVVADVSKPSSLALRGIVRRPFLAPVKSSALALAPRVGETTHVVTSGSAGFRALPALAHRWSSIAAIAHDVRARDDAITTLVVMSDGGAIVLVVVDGTGRHTSLTMPRGLLDSPWVTRVEQIDLDGDGRAEWLVEVVERLSHGIWSRLFILAGDSTTKGLGGGVVDLGGNRGEGDDDTRYAWLVDDGHLFVGADRDRGVTYESIMLESRAPVVDSHAPAVAVTGTFAESSAARLTALTQTYPDGGRSVALPVNIGKKDSWAVGRCFARVADAKAWATQVGGRVL